MSAYFIECVLFGVYLVIGPFACVALWFILFKGRDRMALLSRPADALPASPPRVTLLIPAKDEGARIRDCVESALRQDYPNFHVVVIDDRSTDATGAILDEMAQSHPGLKVLHVRGEGPPPGWTGKCAALARAMSQADPQSRWLLFVDSDMILERDVLSASVALCERKNFDLLSLLPRCESHSFWESLLVPLAGMITCTMFLVTLMNMGVRGWAFANGQFLFIRRSVYDAIGGHAAVRNQFCEDVALARLLTRRGFRPRIAWGGPWASVRMYDSLSAIVRGWSRNFFAGDYRRPARLIAGASVLLTVGFGLYAALIWGIYRHAHPPAVFRGRSWIVAALVHIGLLLAVLWRVYGWSGNRRSNAFLFPLSLSIMAWMFVRAFRQCFTGRLTWRGTSYDHRLQEAASPLAAGAAPFEQSKAAASQIVEPLSRTPAESR